MVQRIFRIRKIGEDDVKILKKRIDIALAIIISLIALLIARLWFLQIHQGAEYSKLSESNRIRERFIAAPRGNVLDRKNKLLITNRPQFNVAWIQEDTPNPDQVIKNVAQILKVDISDLYERIRKGSDRPRYMSIRLKEDIDWKSLVYIENHHLDLPGIRIEVLPARDYLYGNLASHLIGYLAEINKEELSDHKWENYQIGDRIGKMGVEKLFEKELRGEKGQRFVEVDVLGFEQKHIKTQKPLPGNDIYLTLDIDMQLTAEEAMADKAGSVVAMDVKTGKVLVLVSSPPLRIKEFVGGIPAAIWKEMLNNPLHPLINKSIQGQYPPGSTYKIVTALAALSEQVITPETIFYCTGSLRFGNRRYGCWKRAGHGAANLHKALAESCDVYFYHVSQRLGVDTLARYANNLGLGLKTSINLEHEKGGLVPTSSWKLRRFKEPWQEGETLSIAIGQGFDLATPLQICQMTAAITNGGVLYRPQYIETIKSPEGVPLKSFTPIVDRKMPVSKGALARIKKALVSAVNDKHGTGGKAKLKTITVGGKTGTAQVVRLSQHKDLKEDEIPYKYRDHAWFTCFAPAEDPEIAVTVLVEHGGHGGSAAAPVAKKVLTRYFNIQEEDTESIDY